MIRLSLSIKNSRACKIITNRRLNDCCFNASVCCTRSNFMAPSPKNVSDSDSDDEFSNFYSGAAKRFKKSKDTAFPSGVVKLVSSPSARHPKFAKRSPSPERIDVLDSSDEELFRNVDEDIKEDNSLDQSTSAKYHQVETLEDVEEYITLSPDIAFEDTKFKRAYSSASVTVEEDDLTFEEDPLSLAPINTSVELGKSIDENEKFIVKVRFIHEKVWRIEITRGEYFKSIFQQLSEKAGVPVNNIKLYHNDQVLDHYDSLMTVPLKITDILDAVIANEEETAPADQTGMLEFKIQGQNKGAPVMIAIRAQDPMAVLMQKYADATSNDVSKLVFKFDGELLNDDDTPEILDMEGGECIDVYMKN